MTPTLRQKKVVSMLQSSMTPVITLSIWIDFYGFFIPWNNCHIQSRCIQARGERMKYTFFRRFSAYPKFKSSHKIEPCPCFRASAIDVFFPRTVC